MHSLDLEPNLDVRLHESVYYLTLNQPQRRNALSDDVLDRLLAATVEIPPAARAIVIRGAGDVFCAGGDIKQFQQLLQTSDVDAIAAYNRRFGTFLERLAASAVPVIAAVQGAAMGGGMGLAAAADITVATPGTRFSLTETTIGLPPAQICPFVVARVGAHTARRLMLTAARIDVEQAYRLGLVDDIVTDLDAAVDDLVASIRRCAPGANATTKRLVARCGEMSLTDTLDLAARDFGAAMVGDEAREGVRAFLDRRAPAWAEQVTR